MLTLTAPNTALTYAGWERRVSSQDSILFSISGQRSVGTTEHQPGR